MKPKQLASQLKTYNKWRRGCEKTPQPSPRELGILIDRTIEELKKETFTVE